ncbi:hypothetical protein [Streptomyces fructofermentans]|uniref:Uncharacterized protein n=1 Tax=Streptomyces fructofermentans TaxID=152141 RepID=A0A918NWP5_9ACTN|nr:hypothetical protein [Streptomyces fructofermentans]GGX99769.1 hypothetical protein GCM10010515_77290 [Streptomyces fructofermentans]
MSTDSTAVVEDGAPLFELDLGMAELVRMSDVLARWETRPWAEVQEMAQLIGPRLLGQLVGRGLWDDWSAAEQASLHWAMAEGHSVGCVLESYARREYVAPRIHFLRQAIDRTAVACGAYGHTRVSSGSSLGQAEEYLARFTALPEGWRVEVMRRAASGGDIVAAIAEAAVSRNVLRSVYGMKV